jgi:hypothetical protein
MASSSPGVDSEGRSSPQPGEDILRLTTEIVNRFITQRASKFLSTLSGRADVRLASCLDRCRRLADDLATWNRLADPAPQSISYCELYSHEHKLSGLTLKGCHGSSPHARCFDIVLSRSFTDPQDWSIAQRQRRQMDTATSVQISRNEQLLAPALVAKNGFPLRVADAKINPRGP